MGKEIDSKPNDEVVERNQVTASAEMCLHCFHSLINHLLRENSAVSTVDFSHHISPDLECPLFVTWDILSKNVMSIVPSFDGKKGTGDCDDCYILRGCIGSLSSRRLKSALAEYALTAALRDRRFQPIELDEIPFLRVAVSLLVEYEVCDHVHDWEIGKHGIIIKFIAHTRDYSATFLPEVALEQNWSREKTVESLIRKSGFHGEISDTFLSQIQCTRYQSSKNKLTYSNYILALGHDPIQMNMRNSSHASSRHRKWKDIFHL